MSASDYNRATYYYVVVDNDCTDDAEATLVVKTTEEGVIIDVTDPDTGEVIGTWARTAQELADLIMSDWSAS
jgi:hypothetical protein